MKGLQISSGCLLLIVAVIGKVSAIYDMNTTCQYMSVGFIANPSNCQSYGFCNNSMLQGTAKCPNGYLYNSKTAMCDIPSNVECINDRSNVCIGAVDGKFVADPTNCNGYCYCSGGKAQCTTCPGSQLFDSAQTKCVYSSEKPLCNADSICRLVPDKVFLGHPGQCGEYIACLGGEGTPGKCSNGHFFNSKIGMCQTANPCKTPSPVGVGPGVLQNLDANPGKCMNPLVQGATADKPKYISDGQTCMGYYKCTSMDGPGTWGKCPKGLHFNNGDCVTPYSFPCAYDRCGNLNRTFVGAINNNCQYYLICKNETSQANAYGYTGTQGMKCVDNKYFNEFTGTCDAKSPKSDKYKLCV